MKITELSKKKAVPSRQRDPGALATRSHIASQEKRHADWAEKQRELQKQFYANHPELADTKGTTEGSVNKKPQPYNDPNWIKNLPKEKLDALAGPRYTKRPKKNKAEPGVAESMNEMDKSAPQPGRDGKISHSTYGSRDKKGSDYFKGKEAPGKPITKKQAAKDALDILKKQGVAEVSDATLTSYLTKVDADARKHPNDPTKRPAPKRNKSVAGFSRAFNKLDARKAQELAPRVGESTEEEKQQYERAARDVVKGADPDHIARIRKLDPELLRQHVAYAWEKVNRGEYRLNRPDLEETDLQAVVNAQQGGMPLANVKEASSPAQQAAIAIAMKKAGKKPKTEDSDLDEACWDTHRQQGMKKKGDRMVPNCVPKESIEEARESCPECGGPMFPALILGEKQDACYYKVKSRYKVWPSAYASGALVQCRKKGAANWGNKGK